MSDLFKEQSPDEMDPRFMQASKRATPHRCSADSEDQPTIATDSSAQFLYRKNHDGTFDSICPVCLSTVARAPREEWLRLAAEGSQMGLWYWDEMKQQMFCDTKTREMFGVPVNGDVILDTLYRALHPDDLNRVKHYWRYVLEHGLPCEMEYRSVWPDGSIRWIDARGKGYYDEAGKPLCMIGVVFDITERKEAELERVELSRRLINAQEQERARLAREIHDDFSQRLAVLANELEVARRIVETSPREASERLLQLQTSVDKISADLHALSHRLHSSILEYLGLAPAVRSYCEEMAKQYQIQIDVHQNVPKTLPPETALCLFRIVQEGIRNVIKHSRASRVDVRLEGGIQVVYLTITDNGVGFDPSSSFASSGIGIISMRERARMLSGTFDVLSQPAHGTRIDVTVPLDISGVVS
jgi:PAS domain S-box-containing protein